jgi:hypothetical protein
MTINTSIPEIINPSYVSREEFNDLKSAYEDTLSLLANACKRITQLENEDTYMSLIGITRGV